MNMEHNMRIQIREDIVEILLDTRLFPKKKIDISSKRVKNDYNWSSLCLSYQLQLAQALDKIEKKDRPGVFKEKVVLMFTSVYRDGEVMYDNDNFEIKPLIDAIRTIFLQDDGPQYSSLYMDAIINDELPYKTKVVIIPASKLHMKFI